MLILFFAIAGIISLIVGLIFGLRSCNETKDIERVKCFMGETITIHDGNYEVEVKSCETLSSIEYVNKKGETIVGEGNYISVEILIRQFESSDKKSHKFDTDDFKLKDHTGAHIPLNDVLGLVNIDAMDMIVNMDENDYYVSNATFKTKKAVKDYTWIGEELSPGTEFNLSIYFELPEEYRCEDVVMVLEVDFFRLDGGTDIALAYKKNISNS